MNIDTLMLNIMIILFPILINVLNDLYIKNIDKEKNELFLDISLLSSLYLYITLNDCVNCFSILINIIFLISLIKKRLFTSIIIFITIIFTYKINGIFNVLMVLQYIVFYALYFMFYVRKKEKKFINLFFLNKVIFIFLENIINSFNQISIINSVLISIIFTLSGYLIINLVKISEDIVKLHMNIKSLEEEKQIRDSLFKITHEIKNPIAVCKSYLDMFDFNNKDHERYIKILKEEMNNILILLQDFSCMRKIKINSEILDINLLLEEISRQLEPVLSSEDIEFISNVGDEELYIDGDYNRLGQVLTNIIKNAKEAKDNNKKSFVKLKTKNKNNIFEIIIEDNGIGISKEDIKKIDEPFFTTKKNGTGLGVPLSCEIIKAHGGKIEFNSEEGKGTKVIIKLPIRQIEL